MLSNRVVVFAFWMVAVSGMLIYSCTTKEDAKDEMLKKIIVDLEKGVVRGVDPGMSLEQVKQQEKSKIADQDSTYLLFEEKKDSSLYYSISYEFEAKQLKEIQLDIFLKNEEAASQLFEKLKGFYINKYGQPVQADFYSLWLSKTSDGKNVELTIQDESADYIDRGKLTLLVRSVN